MLRTFSCIRVPLEERSTEEGIWSPGTWRFRFRGRNRRVLIHGTKSVSFSVRSNVLSLEMRGPVVRYSCLSVPVWTFDGTGEQARRRSRSAGRKDRSPGATSVPEAERFLRNSGVGRCRSRYGDGPSLFLRPQNRPGRPGAAVPFDYTFQIISYSLS